MFLKKKFVFIQHQMLIKNKYNFFFQWPEYLIRNLSYKEKKRNEIKTR